MATVKRPDELTIRMTRKAIRSAVIEIRGVDEELDTLDVQLTPLEARKRELAKKRDAMRAEILESMQELKLDAAEFTNIPGIASAKVSVLPARPKVEVVDVTLVPKKFLNEPTVKKAKVMEFYTENQEEVPGCEIVVGERSIRIDYSQ